MEINKLTSEEKAAFFMYKLRLQDMDDYLSNKANDYLKLKMMKIFQKYPQLSGDDFPVEVENG